MRTGASAALDLEKAHDEPCAAAQALGALLAEFRKDPASYEANKRMALFLSRIRKYQLYAEPHILKALSFGRKDEDTPFLLDHLAHVYTIKGHYDEAAKLYATALKTFPEIVDFSFRLGDALFRVGRVEDASKVYRQAIDGLYRAARTASAKKGEGLVHVLEPSAVVCRFFGELAAKIDLYLKARELGLVEPAEAVLHAPEGGVANPCLLDYWRRYIRVVSDPEEIERRKASDADHHIYLDYYTVPRGLTLHRDILHRVVQARWEAEGRPPLLRLEASHATRGWDRLQALGVPRDAWFVCLHVREAGFFDEDVPWNHNRHRNAEVETYIPAIRTITGRGGWVVRLGDSTMTPLPAMDGVIDYALSPIRSDWMDVFLIAAARFYLGMASGPSSTAVAFGVPTLGTNWFSLGPWPYCKDDIFIHKLLRSTRSGRILGIAESLKPPLFGAMEPLFFQARGLEVLDNTADEINEAVIEMLDRLDGSLTYSEDDDRLQGAYRTGADPYGVGLTPRVAKGFLERHPELIGAT